MALTFQEDGLTFQYPENWRLERNDNETGWTVSLESPETAFFMITFDGDMPDAEAMAETALAALKEEYPGLEADPCLDSVAGQPAFGHEIRFFSFDLTNTCWTRSFYGMAGTVFLLCQTTGADEDDYEPALRGIGASMRLEEE